MKRVLMLTSGTRGDVQPFVSLGIGLKQVGFVVRICAHGRFQGAVEKSGLEFSRLDDVPHERTNAWEKHPYSANERYERTQRLMFARSLRDAECAAEGCDLIIFHPKVLAGSSLAEAHGVPGVMILPTPALTPTNEFALPLITSRNLGGVLNRYSYNLLRLANLAAYEEIRLRPNSLGLTDPARFASPHLGKSRSPKLILYPVSPSVVPQPKDWPDSVHLTGYWFLEEEAPSRDLAAFIAAGEPPVVVSFGAMTGQHSRARTLAVINAVERLKRRAVLVSGWDEMEASGVLEAAAGEVFVTSQAPFSWLFRRSVAVVHHGGAGTTAEAMRAGIPSLVSPFIGDQYFWGARVQSLGVGPQPIPRMHLTVERLTTTLGEMLTNKAMYRRAEELGRQLRREKGVQVACQYLQNVIARDSSLPDGRRLPGSV